MKERTLNEYRQTKEYQGSSEGWKYLNDLENTKKEKLKKLEQAHKIPEEIQKIQEELEYKDVEFDDLETPSKSFIEDQEAAKQMAEIDRQEQLGDVYGEWANTVNNSEEMKENRKLKNPVESAKDLIINKIIKHFDDVMFEMVTEEMSKNYMFQENNYLTEAGMDEFEEAWFEWYHNHHGDILYEVKRNLFE